MPGFTFTHHTPDGLAVFADTCTPSTRPLFVMAALTGPSVLEAREAYIERFVTECLENPDFEVYDRDDDSGYTYLTAAGERLEEDARRDAAAEWDDAIRYLAEAIQALPVDADDQLETALDKLACVNRDCADLASYIATAMQKDGTL